MRNTVKVNAKVAKQIFEATSDGEYNDYFDEDGDDVTEDGKLYFNPDAMEHQDYLSDERVQNVLKEAKVKGDVCFGDTESSEEGSFWGYRFDGEGGMVELVGDITWSEV